MFTEADLYFISWTCSIQIWCDFDHASSL